MMLLSEASKAVCSETVPTHENGTCISYKKGLYKHQCQIIAR